MIIKKTSNVFAQLLMEQGNYVITVEGIDWYEYMGFMMPAYFPHCCPWIDPQVAEDVVRISGRPFARWCTQFGQIEKSEWWYILKRGPWSIEDIKDKKKRWMIRQGKKNFTVRPLKSDEILDKCAKIAKLSSLRYKGEAKIETQEILETRVAAMNKVGDVSEFLGCFHGDQLVAFSENYIQADAVWLVNIRYDPAFLNKYLSYGLVNGILDYYLNQKKMEYVLDGSRRIHHRTEFQEQLMRVFGFIKEYAILNIKYSAGFKALVNAAYPFKNLVWTAHDKWTNIFLDNVAAVLRQEYIRRSFQ